MEQGALPVPVISVGNLAVGGTGKTPMTLHLAEAFGARGRRVGILTRGYGGSHKGKSPLLVSDGRGEVMASAAVAGDEAVLMALRLSGVAVAVCADRVAGGRLLVDRAGVDLMLLDDGFQHLALVRDADVVLVDGVTPFGNGGVLPRGPLRESPRALTRADWVVARDPAGVPPDSLIGCGVPVVTARTVTTGVTDGTGKPCDVAPGTPVLAVCGIARPERFWATLAELPFMVRASQSFSDHARYGPEEVADLCDRARACGAEAVVTTEKDGVKLAPLWPEGLPLRVVRVGLEVTGDDAWVAGLLAGAERRFAARVAGAGRPR